MERDDEVMELLRSTSAVVPRFLIQEELERTGGFVTFRAWDESLAREIVVRTAGDAGGGRGDGVTPAERRLIAEARVTGGLSHPGVLPVHELALDAGGRPYFVTRLLRGATFREVIAEVAREGRDDGGERGFTLARAIDALRAACDTIAHAHSRGVTHGSLSPEKVVVGEFGETYVIAWGGEHVERGESEGRAAEPAADVRAMGAMLLELLAGRGDRGDRELAAIGRKATARDAGASYAAIGEMAADLHAWLEQRVVRAHRTGALAELRKWVARNRATAALLAVALVVAIGGAVAADAIARARNRELSATRDVIASSLADIRRLRALKSVRELVPQADAPWPAVPANLPAMRRWLDDARELVAERPLHRARLATLDSSAGLDARRDWWRESLQQLVASLDALAADTPHQIGSIAEMSRRIASAGTIEQRSLGDHEEAWSEAIAAIEADPRFRGLRFGEQFGEQLGLAPLGRDPDSGGFEFWDVDTGEEPLRDPKSGRIVVADSMALVFVLIPGLTLKMDDDAGGARKDLTLDPYFISKFEMTQGQWLHVTGSNPSGHAPAGSPCQGHHELTHPVELVSFETATAVLRRLGLELPTYMQWQYASRAGTQTNYWTGDDAASVQSAGNIADRRYVAQVSRAVGEEWDDGYPCTAPVGSFRANRLGLHDTIGNVEELCRDAPFADDEVVFSSGDGACVLPANAPALTAVLFLGGSYARTTRYCTYATVGSIGVGASADSLGLRPTLALTRHEKSR